MKRKSQKYYRGPTGFFIAIGFSIIVMVLRFWDPYPIQLIRVWQFDLYQQIQPRASSKLPVIIIDIDEASLQAIGQFPWSRTIMAKLVDKLNQAGAAVIGLDFIFPEPDRLSSPRLAVSIPDLDPETRRRLTQLQDSDEVFARAIANAPVVVGAMARAPTRISRTLNAPKAELKIDGANPDPFVPVVPGLIGNLPSLEEAAHGFGSVTLLPEIDGVVRRIPTLIKAGDLLYPSLGVEMLRVLTAANSITVHSDTAGVQKILAGAIDVPTDRNGLSWIRYNEHDPSRYISAITILNDEFNPADLAGAIVIVGTSAAGLFDIRATPMGHTMPGVEIWAQWLETSIFDQPLVRPDYIIAAEFLLVIFICLLLTFLLPRLGALLSLITIVCILGSLLVLSWYLFVNKGVLLEVAYPAIMATLLFNLLIFLNYFSEERQRYRIRNAFEHYLSPDLVEQFARNPDSLRLNGETREITSLFTDISDFTTLAESAEPMFFTSVINEYLDGMCRIIIEHNGTIDKIIGDGLHALFGAPQHSSDHPEQAVKCALALDRFGTEFMQRMRARNVNFGITRIGVNTGSAIVGNFGGNARFDYTAFGDTINTASRIEGANKYLGTHVCVTSETASKCKELAFRPSASLIVKGRTKAIDAFEPITDHSVPAKLLACYTDAYAELKRQSPTSLQIFESILEEFPQDPLTLFHTNRLRRGEKGATIRLVDK